MNYKNVLLFLENRTEALNKKVALGMNSYLGWNELTFYGLGILSKRLANYLINSGIDKGDRVAIISESLPEWGAALFASVLAGSISVPLDIKLTQYEMENILDDCKPKVLIVSNKFLETGLKIKENISSIENIIILNDSGSNKAFPSLYNIPDGSPDTKWRHRAMNKTALIIYTSGTTGKPKGVEITFKNMMAQVNSIGKCFDLGTKDKFLSILPMNHLYELSVGFLSFLSKGASIYYSTSLKPKDLFPIIQEKQITFMVVVPAFMKLMKNTIEAEIKQFSPIKKFFFNIKFALAKYVPSYTLRRKMFPTIHKIFGGKFKGCISGGAPLDFVAASFFETIGIKVYEGYGLSEASPLVSINTDKASRLGSVGKAIPDVKVKIDENTGELLVAGDNIMQGYYGQPELTREVLEPDGWLHTGDIAKIDKDGFIYITGRIKSMIVLSGGKKIFPEDLESVYALSPLFAEVCVFGARRKGGQKDGTEDIYVAVVPSQKALEQYTNKDELDNAMKNEVKNLSAKLAHYKRPKNVLITQTPFPRTSTRKVKRKEVKKFFMGYDD